MCCLRNTFFSDVNKYFQMELWIVWFSSPRKKPSFLEFFLFKLKIQIHMIIGVLKSLVKAYFRLLKEFFEVIFGVKIYRLLRSLTKSLIKFIKCSFIAVHITLIVFLFMSTSHSFKWLEFHKNAQSDYFGYHL